ncbi:MAG: prepilin-type N-terminal cleavage/methylation domain-containing protein [Oscillospiraceae bacterium]|nr:prepilin-type N-terminal cleavage/methylation domain-containing protein [Oscillospiraceae bacterium]
MNFKKTWKRFMNMSRSREGFTLVELIVVIAILAILAGVGIPVYSGYIKKANEAADQQLLGVINTAFGAACLENDTNAKDLGDGEAVFNVSNMTVEPYNTEFQTYFAGNSSKFKTVDALYFVDGVFVVMELSDSFKSVLETLQNSEDIGALLDSVYGEMGANKLMNKVDYTSNLAASLLEGAEGTSFHDLLTNCSDAMATMMNLEPGSDEAVAAMKSMFTEKVAQLKASDPEKYADVDVDTLWDRILDTENGSEVSELEYELSGAAQNSISANNAILAAALNSGSASEKIIGTLTDGNPTTNLITAVKDGANAGDTSEAMAQVAMAYGLYTAYAERNGLTVSDNPGDVLDALDDDGFQTYLETPEAAKDLAGYKASMNMVTSIKGNKEAVSDVMVNGFSDPQLVAVLQQAMAQGGQSK